MNINFLLKFFPGLEAKLQGLPAWVYRLSGAVLVAIQYWFLKSNGLSLTDILTMLTTTIGAVSIGTNDHVFPKLDTTPLAPVEQQEAIDNTEVNMDTTDQKPVGAKRPALRRINTTKLTMVLIPLFFFALAILA